MQTELKNLGVAAAKSAPGAAEPVCCWLQVLSVQRDPTPPPVGPQTAVLFELTDPEQLPVLVGEMLRLNNDRQSYRWLASEDDDSASVLLRVIGPPYYSLLRALDRNIELGASGARPAVRAYVERSPRLGIEVGCNHPLADKIGPPEGKMLLMRPARDWQFLDDAPFKDIYEILDFQLPGGKVDWQDAQMSNRLPVAMRLVPGDVREDAELWVLRNNPVEQ